MEQHFNNCYTAEDIKDRYRSLAMQLHPDKGGTNEAFQELQRQYEYASATVSMKPKLPEIFRTSQAYTYYSEQAMYTHCDNHYYYFKLSKGATLRIDERHLQLIKNPNNYFKY